MMGQAILIVDDDSAVTEGLALTLQDDHRQIVTCNDIESARLVLNLFPMSHVITDVQFSGLFGFEGLNFVEQIHNAAPSASVILMSGNASPELRREALSRGVVAFLDKPFEIDEIERVINDPERGTVNLDDNGPSIIRVPLLDEIIASPHLTSVFHPIVTLASHGRDVYGFEALARYRGGSIFTNPELLFRYAESKNELVDLDLKCTENALAAVTPLLPHGNVFMNVHPLVFSRGNALPEKVLSAARQSGVPLDQIVLEITEQASIVDAKTSLRNIEMLREHGVRFAIDDVGMAYSHLTLLDQIRPSFLKISQHFGTGFETDATKVKIVGNIVSLARDFGIEVILEGIEAASTAEYARSLNIRYGQGYFYARPAPANVIQTSLVN
ncbi:MAG TPA: EAL domain-containing protein [Thermoanaerobaculia bacterium]|nr:EAL domain-containing protein [Thermoanaerobaculia bacterium]